MSVNKYNGQTGELTTLANGSRIWIGNKAAHDAAKQAGTLPTNCLIAITDDEKDDEYSTDEVLTSKKWIDGKPIYRKVIEIDNPNQSWTENRLITGNIDSLVSEQTIFLTSDNFQLTDFVYAETDKIQHTVRVSANNLAIFIFNKRNNQTITKARVIVEYTKVTD